MKTIEFGEDQLGNLSELAQQLFADENDPASPGYQRVFNRPDISWTRVILLTLFPIAAAVGVLLLLLNLTTLGGWSYAAAAAVLIVCLLLAGKRLIINYVKVYQHYAPETIRRRCRFEPSCSEYMILALEKYGLFKGLKKGINRLGRCKIPNGGYDYP